MSARRVGEVAAWILTAAVLVEAVRPTLMKPRPGSTPTPAIDVARASGVPSAPVLMFDGDTLERAAERAVERDPFRLERRPAAVPFSTKPMGVPVGVPPGPVVRIVLQGIIGPPWQAILSGIPGRDGTVLVQAGDTIGGIAIRKVTRDSTILRMKDSTWVETLTKR